MNWLWVAAGIARIVVGPHSDPPDMQPDAAVLYVHRANTCLPDGGLPDAAVDAGSASSDAGTMQLDAAPPPDAFIPDAGAGSDAGIPDAGTAGCGDSVMMVVEPRFTLTTNGSTFALLYVTPAPPVMRLEASSTFDDLDAVTAPLIETEIREIPDPALGTRCEGCSVGAGSYGGCGVEAPGSWYPPAGDGGVGGSTIQTIGPYEAATLQPASRSDLATWLDGLGYVYQTADLDALEPYISQGWSVVAVRIAQPGSFSGALQPLSMTWAGSEITVPLRLASQSSLTVYISADHRYELPGAHVSFAAFAGPTYVTRNEVSDFSSDATAFRASVDDWTHDVTVIYQDKHVPVTKPCEDQGCCQSGTGSTNALLWSSALLVVIRRRRRR